MTTPIPIYRYPLDGTGLSPDNLVVGEEHQLSTRPVRCIAPIYGGFFAESVVVKDLATDLPLIYGTDYTFGELFEFPTGRYGKEIFGLIAITKPNVAAIKINYQALGGDYAYSMDAIIQMIDSLNLGNRPVAWGEIIGHPIMFNPASHLHDIGDVYGFEYVVHSIERLRAAVLLGDVASHDEIYRYIDSVGAEQAAATAAALAALNAHIADKNNPHATTKDQVGLGSVQNYATANQAQMDAGTASNLYVTPNIVAKYVLDKAISPFNLHTADKNNPHEVTKTQVGLSQVQNYPVASLTEAQAGTATDRYMTPQRTKDAINKIGGDLVTAHAERVDNPHSVTKAQVGLGSVQNYNTATQAQMDAETATNLYTTPAIVAKYVTDKAVTPLSNHTADKNNPHEVTKTQVGLSQVQNYPVASLTEAQAGTATDRYMTPQRTAQAISALTAPASHLADRNNPHAVTKAQVGLGNVDNYLTATSAEVLAGTATDRFVTPKGVKDAVTSWLANNNHDDRYVRKDASNVSGSIHIREDLGTAYVWVGGGWRQFWPPQWQ